ncbi:MAG: hypothetical protein RQ982_13335 [Gammaproteobacteria bacterium]|nr:hypothetical protein [Gammaproteobacteria bacterium]
MMMKTCLRLLITLLSSFFIFFYSGVLLAETNTTEQQHNHGHEDHAVSGLSLDHGKKWKTDAALRQGMQGIDDAAMKAVPAYHDETLTKADANKLARQINDQVNYLIENCKLEPGADTTLHVFIGDFLTGSANLSHQPLSPQGLPQIVKTLQLYPDYFEHDGW